jgi:hypothetical protein
MVPLACMEYILLGIVSVSENLHPVSFAQFNSVRDRHEGRTARLHETGCAMIPEAIIAISSTRGIKWTQNVQEDFCNDLSNIVLVYHTGYRPTSVPNFDRAVALSVLTMASTNQISKSIKRGPISTCGSYSTART